MSSPFEPVRRRRGGCSRLDVLVNVSYRARRRGVKANRRNDDGPRDAFPGAVVMDER
jgi:hypothetical protein